MEILLGRKDPEIQHIIEVNFTEVMHRRGGGLLGTTQGDMEDAIEEACRAQLKRVVEYLVGDDRDVYHRGMWRPIMRYGCLPHESFFCIPPEDMQALRKAAGEGE